MGGFAPKATPSPPSLVDSEFKDDDDDDGDDDDAFDDADGVVLDMRVVILRERVSFWIIVLGGVLFLFEGCNEDALYMRSYDHL